MALFSKDSGGGGRTGLSSSSFSSNMFAPRQLLQQILVMQGIYYFIGFGLILFTCMVSGDPFSLVTVFSWEPVRIDTTMGWTLCLLWLLDTFFSVLALTVVVGRSKLALDFTLTLHGIHLLVCWCVAGKFPASKLWWGLQVVSILLMLLLGTWTTQWRELRATFFEPGSDGSPAVIPSLLPSAAAALIANQDNYNEYELQDNLESQRAPTHLATTDLSSSRNSSSNNPTTGVSASSKAKHDTHDINDFSSEDEGDLTAGSKLLRDSTKRY